MSLGTRALWSCVQGGAHDGRVGLDDIAPEVLLLGDLHGDEAAQVADGPPALDLRALVAAGVARVRTSGSRPAQHAPARSRPHSSAHVEVTSTQDLQLLHKITQSMPFPDSRVTIKSPYNKCLHA